MKTETNIYDINGEIIRQAGDNHEFTISEAQERLQHYRKLLDAEKLAEEPDKKKIDTYNIYINNLANYVAYKMTQLSSDELADLIGVNNLKKTDTEDINKTLNDTETTTDTTDEVPDGQATEDTEGNTDEESGDAETVGRELSDVSEKRPLTQDDLLVERDNVTTNMDEIVEVDE